MRRRLEQQQRARTADNNTNSHIAENAQEWLAQQMAAAQQQVGVRSNVPAGPLESADTIMDREIRAQQTLESLKVDPEINRIASHFFNFLIERINREFRYENPDWDHLGAREKQHWLAATEALLEEMKKEPVTTSPLSQLAHKRIIQQ